MQFPGFLFVAIKVPGRNERERLQMSKFIHSVTLKTLGVSPQGTVVLPTSGVGDAKIVWWTSRDNMSYERGEAGFGLTSFSTNRFLLTFLKKILMAANLACFEINLFGESFTCNVKLHTSCALTVLYCR